MALPTQAVRGVASLPAWLRRLGYYGLALLFVAAAAMLRWELRDILSSTPFLIFYLAWVGAAAFGGLGPGLLATVASWLCVDILFDTTPGQVGFTDPASIGRLAVLLAGGLTVSLVAAKMQRGRIRERRQGRGLAHANAVLRESEERLRQRAEEVETLMDLVPAAIWVAHDPQCNHIMGNQAANRLYEVQGQENVSANVSSARRFFRDGQELKPEELPMQEAAAQNIDIRNAEVDVLLPSGTWRNVLGSASPLHDAEGGVRGCIGAFMDITERKQAEEALRESEEKYRYIVETATEGIVMVDAHARTVFANDRWSEIFGYSLEEAKHMTHFDMVFPEDRAQMAERWESRKRGLKESYEFRFRRKDGRPVWALIGVAPRLDPEGRFLGTLVMVTDITKRKQAEEALRQSERQFKSTFENAAIGIAHVALDGRILQPNNRFCEIAGYSCDDILGKTCEEITFADDWRAERAQMQRLLDGEVAHYAIEKRYLRRDGNPVWVNLTRSIQHDEAGQPEYFIVLIEDISARKRAEEALRELTATLESKVAQRTAEVKHRIRQLQKLTVDMSEVEDRERRRLAEILHDDLQQVLAAAKFQVGLMRNRVKHDASLQVTAAQLDHMLKDAIGKSRSLSHELSPAVLHHADFTETLQWLAGQVQAKHGLVVHVDAHGPVRIQSDAIKAFLYKTAQEMLFNVVKHARVNEARMQVRPCRRCICLSVSDRGRGFDPQELREAAGFGLLSIRERIELLGGRMRIKSAKGKGSRFFIVVPDGEPTRAGVEVETRPNGRAKGAGRAPSEDSGRLRVLLADDHEIVRQGLAALLSEEHTVEIVGEAANGREAVDLAGLLEPDVVIMDVSMSLIDGDEATRQIKTLLPKTRVIALSMHDEPETVERMHRAGAESYVLKTAPSEELLAAVRRRSPEAVP